jgi:HSP20 family protein
VAALESFSPQVDITDNGKEIRVTAELPGIDEKDVEISLSGDTLTIRARRRRKRRRRARSAIGWSAPTAAFAASFAARRGRPDKAIASYKKALTITLPKTAAATASKKIAVKTA